MGKTEDTNKETTSANLRFTETEIARFDKDGNFKCVRCGWTHTTTECAELRLVHANLELEKVHKFIHMNGVAGMSGETPVDTLIRGYKTVRHNLKIMKPEIHTEVTEELRKGEKGG